MKRELCDFKPVSTLSYLYFYPIETCPLPLPSSLCPWAHTLYLYPWVCLHNSTPGQCHTPISIPFGARTLLEEITEPWNDADWPLISFVSFHSFRSRPLLSLHQQLPNFLSPHLLNSVQLLSLEPMTSHPNLLRILRPLAKNDFFKNNVLYLQI